MVHFFLFLCVSFYRNIKGKNQILESYIAVNETLLKNDYKEIRRARQNFVINLPDGTETDDDFFSLAPDIIFLLQRAGVSDQDFVNLKRFMTMVVRDLEKVSRSKLDSRVGIALFTDVVRDLLDFKTCCSAGKTELEEKINRLVMYPINAFSRHPQGDNRIVSPYRINITNAFRRIEKQYLNGSEAKQKPKIVIFVANFQSSYSSFRLLLEAVDEISSTKNSGAWLVVIIIDPLDNRQPRLLEDDLALTRDFSDTNEVNTSIVKREAANNNFKSEKIQVEHFLKLTSSRKNFLHQVKTIHQKSTNKIMKYNHLARIYAQILATRKDYGIKVRSYGNLLDPDLLQSVGRLVIDPTKWFGEGSITTTCEGTSNYLERTIWSPGFFSNGVYPDGITCRWRITTRIGYRINLRFNHISIENTFDYVVVYDGFQEEPFQALGNFSGEFERSDLPDVSSTEELMLIVFKSDNPGGSQRSGFYSIWNSIKGRERIDDAQIVFVVDVSVSIDNIYERPIKRYVKQLVKDFYLQEDIDGISESFQSGNLMGNGILKPTKIGLISFDDRTKLLRNISLPASRQGVFAAVDQMKLGFSDTYIGHALDFSRIAQFLLLEGKSFSVPTIAKEAQGRGTGEKRNNGVTPNRKVLFLFTDAQSIDDPAMAAKRLCQNNIVIVVIGVGRVSKKGKQRLQSYCGLYFGIDISSSSVITKLKIQLGLMTNVVSSLPALPSLSPFPDRTSVRTTVTIPYIYIYTFPSMAPIPAKKLNYLFIQLVLIIIFLLELLLWFGLVCFETFYANSEYIRESDSKELLEAIYAGRRLPLPTTRGSFFTSHSVNVKELDDFLKKEEKKIS